MKRSIASRVILSALLAWLLSSCASVDTTTYFAAANIDSPNPSLNLYRVRVHADSANSKSSLLTGFYDTAALRSLYGEVTKPTSAPDAEASKALGTYNVVFRDGRWQLMDPAQLYTIVFGPDSKSIAQLVKSYAENTAMGAQFGSLLAAASNPEATKTAGDLENQELSLTQKKKSLGADLAAFASAIDPDALGDKTPEDILQTLTIAAQAIANSMGSDVTFSRETAASGMDGVKSFIATEKNRTP